jgi:formate C-acetyltransferase
LPEKYGNGNPVADALTREFSDFCSALINNRKNGRGGVFRASSFSIDRFVYYGAHTMATPDGRHAGDVLSKNLCATVGQDKNGVTALIRSATEIDHTRLPNGTVLDIVLHPSAVAGEEGLSAFAALLS